MAYRILIVDDEADLVTMLVDFFEGEGYTVWTASNGEEALRQAERSPDIILLDINMPGLDGLEVCGRIRDHLSCPILFLTAKSRDRDKEEGFAAGGDDYLVKPFSSVELKARVNAMLRRYCVYKGKKGTEREVISLPGLEIFADTEEVIKNGERVLLTDIEYRILLLLAENRKKTYTTQDIYEAVWNEPFLFSSNNTVMVHIVNLRKKLEEDPANPRLIRTVWGKGYQID